MTNLQKLFSDDPLGMADIDFDALIASIQAKRHTFITTSKPAAPRKKAAPRGIGKIDLTELGLADDDEVNI